MTNGALKKNAWAEAIPGIKCDISGRIILTVECLHPAHFVVSAKLGDGTMDFLHASVRVASSKERSAAPPPPRSLMDGIWRGQGTRALLKKS